VTINGVVVGDLWIVTDGSGVVGPDDIASRLGVRAVMTFRHNQQTMLHYRIR
jgi:hypothetical protein